MVSGFKEEDSVEVFTSFECFLQKSVYKEGNPDSPILFGVKVRILFLELD
jgi:hypothetical protein